MISTLCGVVESEAFNAPRAPRRPEAHSMAERPHLYAARPAPASPSRARSTLGVLTNVIAPSDSSPVERNARGPSFWGERSVKGRTLSVTTGPTRRLFERRPDLVPRVKTYLKKSQAAYLQDTCSHVIPTSISLQRRGKAIL